MKRLLAALAAVSVLSLALGALPGPAGVFLPFAQDIARAKELSTRIATPTPKPVFPDAGGEAPLSADEFFPVTDPPVIPSLLFEAVPFHVTATPKPVIPDDSSWDVHESVTDPPVTDDSPDADDNDGGEEDPGGVPDEEGGVPPNDDGSPDSSDGDWGRPPHDEGDDDSRGPDRQYVITPEPDRGTEPPPATHNPESGGQYLTSEGPLFLSFRRDLTDRWYMFTPMDLSVDAEYRFPLIGSSRQVVGEARVRVASGLAIVNYYLTNGVRLDEEDEFFTFFPDIRSVRTVDPLELQDVKLEFGIPYGVATWLDSDPRVLLYINCPVSYSTGLSGLEAFSFDDPEYLQRVIELVKLMD